MKGRFQLTTSTDLTAALASSPWLYPPCQLASGVPGKRLSITGSAYRSVSLCHNFHLSVQHPSPAACRLDNSPCTLQTLDFERRRLYILEYSSSCFSRSVFGVRLAAVNWLPRGSKLHELIETLWESRGGSPALVVVKISRTIPPKLAIAVPGTIYQKSITLVRSHRWKTAQSGTTQFCDNKLGSSFLVSQILKVLVPEFSPLSWDWQNLTWQKKRRCSPLIPRDPNSPWRRTYTQIHHCTNEDLGSYQLPHKAWVSQPWLGPVFANLIKLDMRLFERQSPY
jgi:hypothetical protein